MLAWLIKYSWISKVVDLAFYLQALLVLAAVWSYATVLPELPLEILGADCFVFQMLLGVCYLMVKKFILGEVPDGSVLEPVPFV